MTFQSRCTFGLRVSMRFLPAKQLAEGRIVKSGWLRSGIQLTNGL